MYQVLLVVQLLVAFTLIGLIMLQQGKGADAGASFGSGGSGSIFGSRGPASFLAKITALLAAIFFANSLELLDHTSPFQGEGVELDTPVLPQGTISDVPGSDGSTSDVPVTPETQEGKQES